MSSEKGFSIDQIAVRRAILQKYSQNRLTYGDAKRQLIEMGYTENEAVLLINSFNG